MFKQYFHLTNQGIPSRKKTVSKKNISYNEKRLTGTDFLFLMGLALLITFLVLTHPRTPDLIHHTLLFWMSITLLIFSMTPDYINVERAHKWVNDYSGSRLEGLYRKILNITEASYRYFNSKNFFITAIVLTLSGIVTLFYTGEIIESIFGVSYGVFMRAILV